MDKQNNLMYDVDEKPKTNKQAILLAMQRVLAMFGSSVLVPAYIGLDVSVALVTAGIGTLIYIYITKQKVPVFIGASFAFVAVLKSLFAQGDTNLVAIAVCSIGILYILVAVLIFFFGTKWLDTILPPVVIGPLIIIIGLSLASLAINSSGFSVDSKLYSIPNIIIALITVFSSVLLIMYGPKWTKIAPIILGIIIGYLSAVVIGEILYLTDMIDQPIVNLGLIYKHGLLHLPKFNTFNLISNFKLSFSQVILAFITVLPLVLVTISEHIGDHNATSEILGRNIFKDTSLGKTVLADGLSTLVSGVLGGPVDTTFSQNATATSATKVASVFVIKIAAIIVMLIAFVQPLVGLIYSIPGAVMGGISILIFGMLARNGIAVIVKSKVDVNNPRNLLIISLILIIGIGGGSIAFTIHNIHFLFAGTSLAAIIGVLTHLILPDKESAYGETHSHLANSHKKI